MIHQKQSILVWDLPVRVFHWLLVISFSGAWLTSDSERLQMIHYAFGYSACALVLFRLVWGLIGSKYAHFTDFIKGPKTMFNHLTEVLSHNPHAAPGHNPVGGLVMLALMLIILLIGLTGYWSIKDFLGDFMGEAHEIISNMALTLVLLHISAAILMSMVQRENLVKAMITGKKQGLPEQAIRFSNSVIGAALAIVWVLTFYLIATGSLPALTI